MGVEPRARPGVSVDDEPGRERRRRPRGDRPGAVRLQLASRLPWLGCYPLAAGAGAVELHHPLTGAIHSLDRRALACATRTIKQLVREHAAALAEVVGAVDAWQAAALAILDALKPTIHDGAALPTAWSTVLHDAASCRRAARLTRAQPELAPVVEAIGWSHAGGREPPTAALAWLERRRDLVVRLMTLIATALAPPDPTIAAAPVARAVREAVAIARDPATPANLATPVATALLLAHLADQDGDRLVDPLLAALAEPGLDTVSPKAAAYVNALGEQIARDSRTTPPRPPPTPLGPVLRALVPWLATAPTADRRLTLRALAAMALPALVLVWADRWHRLAAIAAPLGRPHAPTWDQLVTLHRELAGLRAELPADLDVAALSSTLRAPVAELLALLESLPALDDPAAAVEVVVSLHRLWAGALRPAVAPAMIRACVGAEPARWPLLWRRVLADGLRRWVLPLADDLAQSRVVGAALGEVLAEAELATLSQLVVIARHRADADTVLAHWRVWRERASLTSTEVGLALTVTTTADEFRTVTAAIGGQIAADDLSVVRAVADHAGPEGVAIIRGLLLAGEQARVRAGGRVLEIAHALDLEIRRLAPAPSPTLTEVLRRYPAVLHPALARVAAAGATAVIAAILDATLPAADDTARELAAIDARLATGGGDARLRKRADNLRARLAAPPVVSAVRLERLRAKLERAADVAAFDRWLAAIHDACGARLRDGLGLPLDARPPWLDAPAYQRVFAAIVRLPAAPRTLARRLLGHRLGPPPWDLRDEPANRAWRERLAARGVDLGPWLAGLGARRLGPSTTSLTLTLEDDPLEVLRMGEHFSTCLAPGAFNFFAAVVNAAEINKRVIYGRDADGQVVGRCLIGVSDGGGLVTFQPYCHRQLDFAAMVRSFATELARRMNTVMVPTGQLTALAGCGWYDDGPRDLTGAFDFLADGAPFRAALATMPPELLLPELARRFAPLPVGGLTLGLLVPLPELDRRPELIVPCLPLLDASDDVPLELRLRAARLAERAGRGELLGDRFVARLEPVVPWWYTDFDVLELVAPRAPSRLLGWLRASRDDVSAHDRPAWNYGLGLALAALHRPTQAADALRAATRSRHKEVANRARAQLRTLALAHPRLAAPPRPSSRTR